MLYINIYPLVTKYEAKLSTKHIQLHDNYRVINYRIIWSYMIRPMLFTRILFSPYFMRWHLFWLNNIHVQDFFQYHFPIVLRCLKYWKKINWFRIYNTKFSQLNLNSITGTNTDLQKRPHQEIRWTPWWPRCRPRLRQRSPATVCHDWFQCFVLEGVTWLVQQLRELLPTAQTYKNNHHVPVICCIK